MKWHQYVKTKLLQLHFNSYTIELISWHQCHYSSVFSAHVAVTLCMHVSVFIARKRISCILQLDEKKEKKKSTSQEIDLA